MQCGANTKKEKVEVLIEIIIEAAWLPQVQTGVDVHNKLQLIVVDLFAENSVCVADSFTVAIEVPFSVVKRADRPSLQPS